MRGTLARVWVAALSALPLAAPAAMVTVNVTGNADATVAGFFTEGEAVTLSFTYDSATPDFATFSETQGIYQSAPGTVSISSSALGTLTLAPTPTLYRQVSILDLPSIYDQYAVDWYDEGPLPSPVAGIRIDWRDPEGTALSSDALPLSHPDIAAFDVRRFTQISLNYLDPRSVCSYADGGSLSNCSEVNLVGDLVVSSSIAPVPLPAAAWLLLSGLGGLGVFTRQRITAA